MTRRELEEALEALSEDNFTTFVKNLGGGHETREQVVRAYVDSVDANPRLERRLCHLLDLRTEDEKRTEATLVAAATSKRSAQAASISALIAALSLLIVLYFTWQDRQDRHRQQELQRTADWEEAKEAMLGGIIEKFPNAGVKVLRNYPPELKRIFMRDILRVLSSQTSNPVLLEHRECLIRWRNAMSTARMAAELAIVAGEEDQFQKMASGVFRDVVFCWDKLILNSDQPAPTGGRERP